MIENLLSFPRINAKDYRIEVWFSEKSKGEENMATQFNAEVELRKNGKTYATYGLYGGAPYSEIEYLNQPITPKENFLRFMNRQDYEWVPDSYSDYYEITTEINPDIKAMGYEGGVDAFGVEWEALETGMPAMVRPGNEKITDITDWRTIKIQDPRTWGWEEEGKKYKEIVDHTRPIRGWITTSLFERLIDVMGFENAASSLLEDPDEVKSFLQVVTDYNLKIVDLYHQYFDLDVIVISDDWATQLQPFFSEQVARDIFLPFLKQISDRVHSYGYKFGIHSCGNGLKHIPVFIEAGIDIWQFQENAVDIEKALTMVGDKLILEGYWMMPAGLDEKGQVEFMKNIFDRYCNEGKLTIAFCDENFMVSSFIRDNAYILGRKVVNK